MNNYKIGLYLNKLTCGGAERVACRLSEILSKHHKVYFIISDDSILSYPFSGELINLGVKSEEGDVKAMLRRITRLKRVKKNFSLDCVVSFLDGPNLVNAFSPVKGCKSIVSIRNYQISEFKGQKREKLKAKMMALLCRKADFVIPVSRLIGDYVTNLYGLNPDKVGVLYNPYDKRQILIQSENPIDDAFRQFKESHELTIVSVGRLSHQKGFWHLLKIVSVIRNNGINAGLLLIGEGSQSEKLNKLSLELGLGSNVMLCGQQPNPFPLEKLSDLYLMTSLFEGFPNCLVEAMCLGVPIVAPDCPSGPREILSPSDPLKGSLDLPKICDFGVLLPELSSQEVWIPTISDEERLWGDYITRFIRDDKLSDYSELSSKRASDFSYEVCYSTLMSYLTRIGVKNGQA